MATSLLFLLAIARFFGVVLTQAAYEPQLDTWNSSYTITDTQSQAANLSEAERNNIEIALNFERSNWATGSVTEDDFYALPPNASNSTAGSLIKVEEYTNTSLFTLPPNTAMSRILFMTEDINNNTVPASAFILWPYIPHTQPDGSYAVIGLGHGASGFLGECAPSHIRNLWASFSLPYPLVLDGYVVVAPDFVGLGVGETSTGDPIYHQIIAANVDANSIFDAISAAQTAFTRISREFVILGHSTGGAAAWAAAERQAARPVDGFLGVVAGSPAVNLTSSHPLYLDNGSTFGPPSSARSLVAIDTEFNASSMLTEVGLARLELLEQFGSCSNVIYQLFPPGSNSIYAQPNWARSPVQELWFERVSTGGDQDRPLSGPMLVLQGTNDPVVPESITTPAVRHACELNPGEHIDYWRFENVTHVPVMFAAQHIYLRWIADRFAGRNLTAGCSVRNLTSSPRPPSDYQTEMNFIQLYSQRPYQIA